LDCGRIFSYFSCSSCNGGVSTVRRPPTPPIKAAGVRSVTPTGINVGFESAAVQPVVTPRSVTRRSETATGINLGFESAVQDAVTPILAPAATPVSFTVPRQKKPYTPSCRAKPENWKFAPSPSRTAETSIIPATTPTLGTSKKGLKPLRFEPSASVTGKFDNASLSPQEKRARQVEMARQMLRNDASESQERRPQSLVGSRMSPPVKKINAPRRRVLPTEQTSEQKLAERIRRSETVTRQQGTSRRSEQERMATLEGLGLLAPMDTSE
jgi:hypothetical protein